VSPQPEVSRLSPELAESVTQLARTLVAAARNWTLYPQDHPAVRASFERLSYAIQAAATGAMFSMGITPDALLIEGHPVPNSPQVVEAARLLHERDLLQLTFSGVVPPEAVSRMLDLLTMDGRALREAGGPEALWRTTGHQSIMLEQIDYVRVLEDKDEAHGQRLDDVWKSIVHSIVFGQKSLDDLAQQRLLAMAGDPAHIGELAMAVMAPKCAADGAPMITTQAATVLAAFRHLAGIVAVKASEQSAETMRNIATAAASLDPHVVMQMMQAEDDPADGVQIVQGLAAAFDDTKVAQLLATALAADGHVTDRLAEVFDTIAPDADRKARVLAMTRTMLSERSFGQSRQFMAIWSSMEELLISYNDKPFTSHSYRAQLDGAAARAIDVARRDLPEEMPEWVETLGQENVRKLSVILIVDLLRLERDTARAAEIANDMTALAEDLLMSGDYDDARTVARALSETAANEKSAARAACREAMDSLAHSAALHETVAILGQLDPDPLAIFAEICRLLGPSVVDTLMMTLTMPDRSLALERGSEIILSFGAPAVHRLAPLVDHERVAVQCNVAGVLGRIGAPEAVPLLQPLLRRNDPGLTRQAIHALANINDPSSARAIQTVLRSATGEQRRVVMEALVFKRDARVVPMLVRILEESEPLGKDYTVVLDTLTALKVVHADTAVRPIDAIMRRRRWFARARIRALKQTSVEALASIGTEASRRALAQAAKDGDRTLRRFARTKLDNAEASE
jgi:HEAT repeat protein